MSRWGSWAAEGLWRFLCLALVALVNAGAGSEASAQIRRDPLSDVAMRAQQELVRHNLGETDLHRYMASNPSRERVVGALARAVPEGFFRDAVAIHRNRAGTRSWLCSGVLVAPDAVLTAGHCVCDLGLNMLTSDTVSRDRGAVSIGSRIDPDRGNAGIIIRVERAITYEPTFCSNGQRGRDLGLVFLHAPDLAKVKFQANIQPYFDDPNSVAAVRIVPSFLYLGSSVAGLTVVGFGIDNFNVVGAKSYAVVPIASRICGSSIARAFYDCRPGQEVVLAGPTADTCRGDSGGPAYLVIGSTYYLAGITSRAVEAWGRCGPGGVYSLITPDVVAWLRKHTGGQVIAFE